LISRFSVRASSRNGLTCACAHTAQVCLDVLLHKQAAVSGLRRSDAVDTESYTSVPIIVSNSDFVFQGSYPVPRMAQGSFHIALNALFRCVFV
jgi:ribonucleotide monophosphatase NagD (HAD superfamily)